jgi:hypothetical protein
MRNAGAIGFRFPLEMAVVGVAAVVVESSDNKPPLELLLHTRLSSVPFAIHMIQIESTWIECATNPT